MFLQTSIFVPQVLKDIAPMMWVLLEVSEHEGSLSLRKFSSMPDMEALSRATVILLAEQWTVALPVNSTIYISYLLGIKYFIIRLLHIHIQNH